MSQMSFFEVSAETSTNVDAAFLRIASDVMQQSFMGVYMQKSFMPVYPASCSLARFCLQRAASSSCPRGPALRLSAYADAATEVSAQEQAAADISRVARKTRADFASAFASSSLPSTGISNAVLVPILSHAQLRRVLCTCGHLCRLVSALMPRDVRHNKSIDPQRLLLMWIFSASTAQRFAAAWEQGDGAKCCSGAAMVAGSQIEPGHAAWEPSGARASCPRCRVHFDRFFWEFAAPLQVLQQPCASVFILFFFG